MFKIIFFLILIFSNEIYAQQFGVFLEPNFNNNKNLNYKSKNEDFFVSNFIVYFGSSTLYEVMQSTQPAQELAYYIENGFYKTELIFLTLLSIDKNLKLKDLINERIKNKSLIEISNLKNYDFIPNFRKALKINDFLKSKENDIKKLHDILINKNKDFEKYIDE